MRICDIQKETISNGPGIRTAVFFQEYDSVSEEFCGDGFEVSIGYVIEELKSDKFSSGITFTGGDPFFQVFSLRYLINEIKRDKELSQKDLWIYTGFEFEEMLYTPIPMIIDLRKIDCIVDGEFDDSRINCEKPFVSSSNQRIIDVKETLKTKEIVEWDYERRN